MRVVDVPEISKFQIHLAVVVAGFALSMNPAFAQRGCIPPINEDCPEAIVFTTADLPFDVTAPLGCVNDVIDKPYFDVFYRYDCTTTTVHHINMCDSDGDTYIRIYELGCGWADGEELAVADDECPGSPPNADPQLSIELVAGNSYWFELGTWRPDPPWAPPANSPYHFRVSIEGEPVVKTCDGVTVATDIVGDPGNSPDTNGLGGAAGFYRIGRYETTNREYVDFLNSVAEDDPNGLYSEDMTDSDRGGIIRTGSSGTYVYFVKASFGDKPVNFVMWTDAARYANWLHNGMPTGPQDNSTTERGAYDMSAPLNSISRASGATWFLPTLDQWYKAAYYDPENAGADAGGTPNYWLYPTQNDSLPTQATADSVGEVTNPGGNVANYGGGADWNGENGNVTTVGGTTSASPWGAFDMGGNLNDWTETPDTPIPPDSLPTRTGRGGDFANSGVLMSSPDGFSLAFNMQAEAANVGFRVAAIVCDGDFDGDGDIDGGDAEAFAACFSGDGGGLLTPLCALGDFDADGDVDCLDATAFGDAQTISPMSPPPAECVVIPAVSEWGLIVLVLLTLTAASVIFTRARFAANA